MATNARQLQRDRQAGKSGIHIKKGHEGRLHAALGVSQGKPIPAKKLTKALHSDNPHMRQMANFARNAKKWHH